MKTRVSLVLLLYSHSSALLTRNKEGNMLNNATNLVEQQIMLAGYRMASWIKTIILN